MKQALFGHMIWLIGTNNVCSWKRTLKAYSRQRKKQFCSSLLRAKRCYQGPPRGGAHFGPHTCEQFDE
eukprot:1154582-Pelagomonas_calceolata.AAC.2